MPCPSTSTALRAEYEYEYGAEEGHGPALGIQSPALVI
jgi:hypothetical protein